MIEKFKYEKRYWYPHMGPRDVAIWERFIDANPGRFDVCIYDYPIGATKITDDLGDPDSLGSWIFRNKKRCDIVAFKGDLCTIIEVRKEAGVTAIGNIVCYDLLYQEYIDKTARPNLMILTDLLIPDMDWLCEEFNVKLEVI